MVVGISDPPWASSALPVPLVPLGHLVSQAQLQTQGLTATSRVLTLAYPRGAHVSATAPLCHSDAARLASCIRQ